MICLILVAGDIAQAGEVELREKWSQLVAGIRIGECADEDKRLVLKKLNYAAVLIMHNEIDEALTVMERAKDASKSASCAIAIKNGMSPSE